MKKYILSIFLLFSSVLVLANKVTIDHFTIAKSELSENEFAIKATDSAGHVLDDVNGHFTFSINGFDENLVFKRGIANDRRQISNSSFIYVKHENDNGTHATLYYIYRSGSFFIPIHISWIVLLAIPILLIALGYLFKKLIILAVIIFVVFVYFNYHHGLGASTFFESIIDGLKGLFNKV